MQLQGKRVAVLAEEDFEDLELWYPVLRLREEGAEVEIIGSGSKAVYKGKHGVPVEVDKAVGEARAADYDALVVPGGWAPDKLRRYPEVLEFVRHFDAAKKPMAAICHAGWVLVSAGILRGRKMTCVNAIKDDVMNAGAEYVDEEVVVDGNLVTSRRPPDLPAYMREFVRVMANS